MTRRILISASLAILLGSGAAMGQISITFADLHLTPGTAIEKAISEDNIEFDVGQSGADQSWDFSAIETAYTYTERYLATDTLHGADQFPQANLASFVDTGIPDMIAYTFYTANEQSLSLVGMAIYIPVLDSTVTAPIEMSRPAYVFPMRYGQEWDITIHTNSFGTIQFDTLHFNIDAWGTVTDRAGTFRCLRLHVSSIGVEIDGEDTTRSTSHEYHFFAEGFGDIVSLTSNDDEENPNFTTGSFVRVLSVNGEASVRETSLLTPETVQLSPAFPNPFNPSTEIGYSLVQPGLANLAMIDPSGKIVSILSEGFESAGTHRLSIDGSALPPGVYFVRLETGGKSLTQKLILVK